MSQYLDRRLKLNANICTICKSFNTCVFWNMLTLTMCFVFVYRYGKFRGRGTGSSRIPRRRSRNTSAWHSLFPSTTGYLVQRRTQNPSQQSDVSLGICLGFFFLFRLYFIDLFHSCTWLFLRDLCNYTSSPEIHTRVLLPPGVFLNVCVCVWACGGVCLFAFIDLLAWVLSKTQIRFEKFSKHLQSKNIHSPAVYQSIVHSFVYSVCLFHSLYCLPPKKVCGTNVSYRLLSVCLSVVCLSVVCSTFVICLLIRSWVLTELML